MRVTPSRKITITVRLKPDTTGTTPGSPEPRRYPRADFGTPRKHSWISVVSGFSRTVITIRCHAALRAADHIGFWTTVKAELPTLIVPTRPGFPGGFGLT